MTLLTWEHLTEYLAKGVPALLPISTNSNICFLTTGAPGNLGLRIPASNAELHQSPYSELEIRAVTVNREPHIQLSVVKKKLHRTFYHFALEVATQIESNQMSPQAAIEHCLTSWAQLLAEKAVLDVSAQIGLIGELCLLHALLATSGPTSFDAWVGAAKEPHDFRLGTNEIEVKSTRSAQRTHSIHGLQQLEPSTGMTLYLLSLQFEPAGNSQTGCSLVGWIERVRTLLLNHREKAEIFELHLDRLGYTDDDRDCYNDLFRLRTRATLTPVDENFPKLTTTLLRQAVPLDLLPRIRFVQYDINVDGLGHEEGSDAFRAVLGVVSFLETHNEH